MHSAGAEEATLPAPGYTHAAGRKWNLAAAGLVLLAGVTATSALGFYPLSVHEIFVAQTAIEMRERENWLVPTFNGEPRLNKPPLGYWLTGLAAWIDGERIGPVHARLPSALAAVGLVILGLVLGRLLFGRQPPLMAGLILVTSMGFAQYSHNARPEMLYAFWCNAGLTAFAAAWKAPDGSRARCWAAHGIWVSFALATLTKGPHVPAMVLVAGALFLAWEKAGWRRSREILRPLSGLALMLVLTLPWWWLVRRAVGFGAFGESQLAGSLLAPDLESLLRPYYLYRPFQLMLPWLVLVPVAGAVVVRRLRADASLRLLLLMILLPVLLLSLGRQQRWYYMLPALLPLCLLMAGTLQHLFADSPQTSPLRRWLAWAVPAQWPLALLSLLGYALWGGATAEVTTRLLWVVVALTGLAPLVWWLSRGRTGPMVPVASSAVLFMGVMVAVFSFGEERLTDPLRDRIDMAEFLGAHLPATTPLAVLNTGIETFVYHTGRPVVVLSAIEEISNAVAGAANGRLVLVLPRGDLERLPSEIHLEILHTASRDQSNPLVAAMLGP